jgi:hypothetical protein
MSMSVTGVHSNVKFFIEDTTDSTADFTGSFISRGGCYIDKKLRVNGTANFASSVNMGALTATTGTFSSNVSMSALTATTGTFSSTVSATGNITSSANMVSTKMLLNGTSGTSSPIEIKGKASDSNWIQFRNFVDSATFHLNGGLSGGEWSLNETGVADYRIHVWHSSGNVGIGNNNNTYKLDVSGTGRFTGLINADAGMKLPTTGGTPATLNDYEEFSQSISFNCRGGVAVAVTIKIVKTGKQCTIYIPSITCTSGSSAPNNVMSATSNLPSRFVPTTSGFIGPARVSTAGGTARNGFIYLDNAGQLQVYLDAPLSDYTATSSAQLLTPSYCHYHLI